MYSKRDRDNANFKLNQATRVILVRHGRSTDNEQGRYQGRSDNSVLTDKGRRDACRTGWFLRDLKLDAIYTSPLKRTQQTASEIFAAVSKPEAMPSLFVSDNLKEINMSAWQGLTYQYVREHFAEEYCCWRERPHQFSVRVKGTQATWQFPVLALYKQAERFWQEILRKHQGRTVLVVGHSGTNRALIGTAIGLPPKTYHYLQQSNCGISTLEFRAGQSQAQLTALNLTAHLGETLPKLKEGKHGLRLLLWSATTETQTQRLNQFLKQERIDFLLSTNSHDSEKVAQCLLQQTKSVNLQVNRDNFPKTWRQVLLQRTVSSEQPRLITGVAIAPTLLLNKILEQEWENRPTLPKEALSIIHYPLETNHPILQALIPSSSL